jgi:hypothetical protein
MIDKKHIGRCVSRHSVAVEAGKLRFFAKAVGETDPVYTDEAVAAGQGHASLPVPPTYLFCLEMEKPDPYDWFDDVGLELPKVLHGSQSFRYWRQCHAHDVLSFEAHIDDIYQKKDGALEFVVKHTRVVNQHGEHVADLRGVIVQRHR